MRFQTLWEARWIFVIEVLITGSMGIFSPWLALIGVGLILFTISFFRDPERKPPADKNAVVAAADGVISDIVEIEEEWVNKKPMKRVGIFLSVFDVHTNRAPIAGKVVYSDYYVGQFLDARHPDATRLNEFQTWGFEGETATLVVRQITGAIARRIVAWSKVGDLVAKGERFGMIRFGSRTEIYVPLDAEISVKVGDRVKGGESIIARLS